MDARHPGASSDEFSSRSASAPSTQNVSNRIGTSVLESPDMERTSRLAPVLAAGALLLSLAFAGPALAGPHHGGGGGRGPGGGSFGGGGWHGGGGGAGPGGAGGRGGGAAVGGMVAVAAQAGTVGPTGAATGTEGTGTAEAGMPGATGVGRAS